MPRQNELARTWASHLRNHGTSAVMIDIPESDVESVFSDCMDALDSHFYDDFPSINRWIRAVAEDIIEHYFSPNYVRLRALPDIGVRGLMDRPMPIYEKES